MIHRIVKKEDMFLVIDGEGTEIGEYKTKASAMKKIMSTKKKKVVEKVEQKVKKVFKKKK